MRLMVLLFFPLLGAFDFLRMQGQPVIGFVIFMLPLGISTTYLLLRRLVLQSQLTYRSTARMYHLSTPHRLHAALFIAYISVMLAGFWHAIIVGNRSMVVGVAEIIFVFSIALFFLCRGSGVNPQGRKRPTNKLCWGLITSSYFRQPISSRHRNIGYK